MNKTRLLTQNIYRSWFFESIIDTHNLWTCFVYFGSADSSLNKEICQLEMLYSQGKEVLSLETAWNVPTLTSLHLLRGVMDGDTEQKAYRVWKASISYLLYNTTMAQNPYIYIYVAALH